MHLEWSVAPCEKCYSPALSHLTLRGKWSSWLVRLEKACHYLATVLYWPNLSIDTALLFCTFAHKYSAPRRCIYMPISILQVVTCHQWAQRGLLLLLLHLELGNLSGFSGCPDADIKHRSSRSASPTQLNTVPCALWPMTSSWYCAWIARCYPIQFDWW